MKYKVKVMCDYAEGSKGYGGKIFPKRDIFNKNEVFEIFTEGDELYKNKIIEKIKQKTSYKYPYVVNIREIEKTEVNN